ncbi:MAG: hypothetical protein AB1609_10265 [Bacillota bacterium]
MRSGGRPAPGWLSQPGAVAAAAAAAFALMAAAPAQGAGAAASAVTLQVLVAEALELGVPSGLTVSITNVAPGRTLEQKLDIPVKANVPWILKLQAAEGARPRSAATSETTANPVGFRVGATSGYLGEVAEQELARGAPTGEAGQPVSVVFEYAATFDDEPGTYAMTLTLVLARQI